MSLFEGIETAQPGGARLPRLGYGKHVVKITHMEGFTYVKGTGSAVVTDYEVVQSGNPADPVGASRSYFQAINKFSLGYIKNFAAACMGVDPREKEKVEAEVAPCVLKAMNSAVSAEQLFKDVLLVVQVDPKPDATDKTKIHANHTFYPYVPATA